MGGQAVQREEWRKEILQTSTPLDQSGVAVHYRLFILVFYLNDPAFHQLRDCAELLQSALLPEQLVKQLKTHRGEVESRFGRAGIKDRTHRADLPRRKPSIHHLAQQTAMHWMLRKWRLCERSSVGQSRVTDEELLLCIDARESGSEVRLRYEETTQDW